MVIHNITTCVYCGQLICRFDAVRRVDEGFIHVSCQREKEYQEGMERLREQRDEDIGGMP